MIDVLPVKGVHADQLGLEGVEPGLGKGAGRAKSVKGRAAALDARVGLHADQGQVLRIGPGMGAAVKLGACLAGDEEHFAAGAVAVQLDQVYLDISDLHIVFLFDRIYGILGINRIL